MNAPQSFFYSSSSVSVRRRLGTQVGLACCFAFCLFQPVAFAIVQLPDLFEVSDPDPGSFDSYSWSAAADGNYAVVGMPGSASGPGPSRAAYVYRLDSGQLVRTLQPISSDTDDGFGRSVAISGNLVVVGSEFEDVGGASNAGRAHVYDITTGNHVATLTPSDPQFNGFVGSVAIDGTNVLLGGRVGAAYLFNALTGVQLAKLTPSTPTEQFGISMAIEGSTAIIGANSDASLGDFTGAAYVFDLATKTELRKIIPADAAAGDNFGAAVAIDGGNAIIGSPLHKSPSSSGAAYVFDVLSGQQVAKLTSPFVAAGVAFGSSVDIDGIQALIGSPNDRRRGNLSGAAYLFDWTTQTAQADLLPNDIKAGDWFGISVGLSGDRMIAGATKQQQGATRGSAYIFAVPEPTTFALLLLAVAVAGANSISACRRRD